MNDLHERLYVDFKCKIENGIYKIDSKLPSIRKAALFYNVKEYYIYSTYDKLYKEGFIKRIPGKGYYVSSASGKYFSNKESCNIVTNSMTCLNKNFFKNNTYRGIINDMFYNSLKTMYNNPIDLFLYNKSGIGRPSLRINLSKYLSRYLGINILPDDIILSASKINLVEYLYRIFNKKYILLENPSSRYIKKIFAYGNFKIKYINLNSEGIDLSSIPKSPSIFYIETHDQFPTGISYNQKCKEKLELLCNEMDHFILENLFRKDFLFEKQEYLYGIKNAFLIGDLSQIFPESIRFAFMVKPRKFNLLNYESNISSITEDFVLSCFENNSLERVSTKLWIMLKEIRDKFIIILNKRKINHWCLSCGPYIVLEINNITTEWEIRNRLKVLDRDIAYEFFYLKNGKILFSFMYTDIKINKIEEFVDFLLFSKI